MGNDCSPETQRASNQGHVNKAMWPSFQLVKYFMPVLLICKFHKKYLGYALNKVKCGVFGTQGQVTPK